MKSEKEVIKLAKLEAKKVRKVTDLSEYEDGFVAGYNKANKPRNKFWSSWFSLYNK